MKEKIEKVRMLLFSKDQEMIDLGIVLFHSIFETRWKNDDIMYLTPNTRTEMTLARLRIYISNINPKLFENGKRWV